MVIWTAVAVSIISLAYIFFNNKDIFTFNSK